MLGIDWSQFTWDVFATLAAGILAVAAAVYLGRRQLAISSRQAEIAAQQTEILARQVLLAELTLRHELFDRRMEVFEAVGRFLHDLIRDARLPEGKVEGDFLYALTKANYLFSRQVNARLDEVKAKVLDLRRLQIVMQAHVETRKPYTNDEPAQEGELIEWFFDRLSTYRDIFGDEIRLTEQ